MPRRSTSAEIYTGRNCKDRVLLCCIQGILRRVSDPDLYSEAVEALEHGYGAEATTLLIRALRRPGLSRDEQVQIRCALAEAWLLQDDVRQAAEALGAAPQG